MNLKQRYAALCSPAKLYLVITGITYILLFVQNIRHPNNFTIGSYSIPLEHHNVIYFIVKLIVIIGWTWLLQKICGKGYTSMSWFLVLIPYILMFVAIGFIVVTGMDKHKRLNNRRGYYQQPYMYAAPTYYSVPQSPTYYSPPVVPMPQPTPQPRPTPQHPLGPGGTQQPMLGPGGTRQPMLGPGGTQKVVYAPQPTNIHQ